MGLSRIFPPAVPVTLSGVTRLAAQLTLGELGRLEAWALAHLDDGPPAGDDASAEELKAAHRRAERPPVLGDPELDAVAFGTLGGRALCVLMATANDPYRITYADAEELAAAAKAEEWAAFDRVAFALPDGAFRDAWKAIDRRLGLPEFDAAGDDDARESVPWEKAIPDALEAWPGESWASLRDMPIGVWRILCDGVPELAEDLPADPELEGRVMQARADFWGEDSPLLKLIADARRRAEAKAQAEPEARADASPIEGEGPADG